MFKFNTCKFPLLKSKGIRRQFHESTTANELISSWHHSNDCKRLSIKPTESLLRTRYQHILITCKVTRFL